MVNDNESLGCYIVNGMLGGMTFGIILGACLAGINATPTKTYNKDVNKDQIVDIVVENKKGDKTVFLGQQDGSYKKLENLQKLVDEALQQK